MISLAVKPAIFKGLENLNRKACQVGEKVMPTVKKVGAIAFALLGAFSAYTSPKIFTAFFIVGAIIGVGSYFNTRNEKEKAHKHASACVDGFFNQISGVKLPAGILVVVNSFSTLDHIDHHVTVPVLTAGLYCGAFAGKHIAQWLDPTSNA